VLKKLLGLLALAALAICPASLMAQTEIISGFDAASFVPFAYMDASGNVEGFDVECVNWIAERAGLKVTHKPYAWESIIEILVNKNINMVASGLSITEERAKVVAFTKPYWTIKQAVLVAADSPLTIEEVLTTNKTIGLQSGTSDLESMKASNNQDGRQFTIQEYPSPDLAIEDVVNGRIDAAVMNDDRGYSLIQTLPVKFLGYAGIPDEDFGYAVSQDDTELLQILNDGIDAIKADPIWDELLKKYHLDEKL
jgi:polar amino acid transport system substrate-binding protein